MTDQLVNLWRELLAPWLSPLWSSLDFWRFLAAFLISLIVVAIVFRKQLLKWFQSKQRNEHDKEIFKRSDALLNERELRNLLDYIGDDHSYRSDDLVPVSLFCRFFSEEQNQFLHKKLRERSRTLAIKLNRLERFISLNFFVFPSGQTGGNMRLCMQPGLNLDRGGDPKLSGQYDQYTKELEKLLDSATSAYNEYRRTVKRVLMI